MASPGIALAGKQQRPNCDMSAFDYRWHGPANRRVSDAAYRERLVASGVLLVGRERGGSIA
jgi:hypothetical protein